MIRLRDQLNATSMLSRIVRYDEVLFHYTFISQTQLSALCL